VHRIGRTGRAGNTGMALSLFHASETAKVKAIASYLQQEPHFEKIPATSTEQNTLKSAMVTLCISSGRKNKIRAGDILGALTASKDLQAQHIGKIDIFDMVAYVAVARNEARTALKILGEGKIKGKKLLVRKL